MYTHTHKHECMDEGDHANQKDELQVRGRHLQQLWWCNSFRGLGCEVCGLQKVLSCYGQARTVHRHVTGRWSRTPKRHWPERAATTWRRWEEWVEKKACNTYIQHAINEHLNKITRQIVYLSACECVLTCMWLYHSVPICKYMEPQSRAKISHTHTQTHRYATHTVSFVRQRCLLFYI